jgi:hypothetical protein
MISIKTTILSISFIFYSFASYAGYDKKATGFYLKHFAQVKDLKDTSCKQFLKTVYRGGQPDFSVGDAWINKIKASKIKVVFDLRSETTNAIKERDLLLANGIGYVKIPLSTTGNIMPENLTVEVAEPSNGFSSPVITKTTMPRVQATLYVLSLMEKVVSEQSENGIYLHCQRGEDRTGLMMALLRECSSTAWKSEFNEYGGVMYKPLQALMDEVSKIRSNR